MEFFTLIENYGFAFVVYGVITMFLVNMLKLPIKHFTAKIKADDTRKTLNKIILALPIFVGFGVYCFGEIVIFQKAFELATFMAKGISIGGVAVFIYMIVEGKKGKVTEYEVDEDGKLLLSQLQLAAGNEQNAIALFEKCRDKTINEITVILNGWSNANDINFIAPKLIKYFADIKAKQEAEKKAAEKPKEVL